MLFGFDVVSNTATSFIIRGGQVLVSGNIFEIPTQTVNVPTSYLAATNTWLLAADKTGALIIEDESAAGFSMAELTDGDSYGDNQSIAPIVEFSTSSGSIVALSFIDRRLVLAKLDKTVWDLQNEVNNVIIGTGSLLPSNPITIVGGYVGLNYDPATLQISGGGALEVNNANLETLIAQAINDGYIPYTGASQNVNLGSNELLAGDIGIGTTNPLNRLDVSGGAVIGSAYAGSVTAPGSGLLVQGSIGIGTTSPVAPLDVNGNANVSGGITVIGAITNTALTNTLNSQQAQITALNLACDGYLSTVIVDGYATTAFVDGYLASYSTTAQMDAYVASSLSSYVTTTVLDAYCANYVTTAALDAYVGSVIANPLTLGANLTVDGELYAQENVIVTGQIYNANDGYVNVAHYSDGYDGYINFNLGNAAVLNLGTALGSTVNIHLSNYQNSGTYVIHIIQHASTPQTVSWVPSVKWSGGTVPTISTGNQAVDIVSLLYSNGALYGSIIQNMS